MTDDIDGYPIIHCPRCGAAQMDMDGFGFIACVPGCGYCTHPAATDGVCGICGDVEPAARATAG